MSFIYLLSLVLLTLPQLGLASESHGHEAIEIPWPAIQAQTFNFIIFVALLIWFARKPVVAHFLDRHDKFTAALKKAQKAKQDAEAERDQLMEQLTQLNDTAADALHAAHREAAEIRENLLREAELLAHKIRQEAERAAQHEIEKARQILRQELLNGSLQAAEHMLSERLKEADQRRLQTEFVDKMQVVS